MRPVSALLCCCVLTVVAFAQNDRGTITGEISDQGNAVVPNAIIVAKNADTGVESKTVASGTGNYTIPSLPSGRYVLTVEAPGFKKAVHSDIEVQVAQTARIDVKLQIGSVSDTVTVTTEAPMLKTESGEQATVIQTERINALPLNFGGGGGSSGNIRSPFAFNMLSPGVTGTGQDTAAVNGLPTGTFRVQIEGQDATSQNDPNWTSTVSHSSVDAIEEFSLQTSTFSAEFSQVGGGFYNFTTKSGTNQLHGGAYEYMTNEDLNAQRPYFTPTVPQTNPRSRKHDFGGTIGGPVYIPKLYNGKNKTFFFFSEEVFRNVTYANGSSFLTLPTAAMRNGDFSSTTLFPGQNIGTDPSGKPILNGAIYDPLSRTTLPNGQVVTTMFPNNVIPQNRFDPVAVKIQNLIPQPTNANPTSNYAQLYPTPNNQQTPTLKIDQSLPDNSRLSFYYNKLTTNQLTNNDSLPQPVSAVRVQAIYGTIARMNYDKPVTPTLLFHAGVGYQRFHNPDSSPSGSLQYDAVGGIGFNGSSTSPSGFPRLNGLTTSFGPSNANSYFDGTLTSIATGTWSHGSHTLKMGGEFRLNSWTDRNSRGAQGILNFSGNETGNPFNNTGTFSANGVSGSVGNAYASFLLGQIDTASVNTVQDPQLRKTAWGLYITGHVESHVQADSRVRRALGLRKLGSRNSPPLGRVWTEHPQSHRQQYSRCPDLRGQWSRPLQLPLHQHLPVRDRPAVGLCLPDRFQDGVPRGHRYQLRPDPVVRLHHQRGPSGCRLQPVDVQQPGRRLRRSGRHAEQWAGLRPRRCSPPPHSIRDSSPHRPPCSATPTSTPIATPAGRPGFSRGASGLQRQVIRDLIVEANYVGNRGAWENNSALLGGLNTPNPATFARYGIDPTTAAGQATLTSTLGKHARKSLWSTASLSDIPHNLDGASGAAPLPAGQRVGIRKWSAPGRQLVQLAAGKSDQALLSRALGYLGVHLVQDRSQSGRHADHKHDVGCGHQQHLQPREPEGHHRQRHPVHL